LAGLQQRDMLLRFPGEDQAMFLEIEGAAPFRTHSRTQDEGLPHLAHPLSQDPALLQKWMSRALAHVSAMPPKSKQPKATKPRKVK
jgi:hypothetical protein